MTAPEKIEFPTPELTHKNYIIELLQNASRYHQAAFVLFHRDTFGGIRDSSSSEVTYAYFSSVYEIWRVLLPEIQEHLVAYPQKKTEYEPLEKLADYPKHILGVDENGEELAPISENEISRLFITFSKHEEMLRKIARELRY